MRTLTHYGKAADVVVDVRKVDVGGGGLAIHHKASAGIGAAIDGAVGRTQNDVSQTVAIDVARAAHTVAALLVSNVRQNCKPTNARCNLSQIDGGIGSGFTKDNIRFATGRIRIACACNDGTNDDVADAIAVDVATAADRDAAFILCVFTFDGEAANVIFNIRKIDSGVASFSQDNVRHARLCARYVVVIGTDQQVGQAIAVNVAGTAHRGTAFFTRLPARNDKASNSSADIAQRNGLKVEQCLAAIDHIRLSCIARQRSHHLKVGADDQVGPAVAVNIASTADRKASCVKGAGDAKRIWGGTQSGDVFLIFRQTATA